MSEARETRWRCIIGFAAALILIVDVAGASAAETPESAPSVLAKTGEATPSPSAANAAAQPNADRTTVLARAPSAPDRTTAAALFALALSGGDWRVLMRD